MENYSMMKKLVFCLSLFLAFLPSAGFADLADYNIYYINGMGNSQLDAMRSRKLLHDLVLPDISDSRVQYLYQSNTGLFETMIERVRQQALLDHQRDIYKRYWRCVFEPSPDICNSVDPLAPSMHQLVIDTLGTLDENAYVQNRWLQAMVGVVRTAYNNGRKSLLVAHSQGNLYANQVVNYLQSTDPAIAACVNIVGVASPATYVAKSGPYETRNDDLAINGARLWWPWGASILPATWNGMGTSPTGDSSGHRFIESYLNPVDLRSRIRGHIDLQTMTDSSCSICQTHTYRFTRNTPIQTWDFGPKQRKIRFIARIPYEGGVSGVSYKHGGTGNYVQLAQTPADGYSTGAACSYPGTYTYTFDYDPVTWQTTKLEVGGGLCGYATDRIDICIACVDPITNRSACDP